MDIKEIRSALDAEFKEKRKGMFPNVPDWVAEKLYEHAQEVRAGRRDGSRGPFTQADIDRVNRERKHTGREIRSSKVPVTAPIASTVVTDAEREQMRRRLQVALS